jgi:hypothetical protein
MKIFIIKELEEKYKEKLGNLITYLQGIKLLDKCFKTMKAKMDKSKFIIFIIV